MLRTFAKILLLSPVFALLAYAYNISPQIQCFRKMAAVDFQNTHLGNGYAFNEKGWAGKEYVHGAYWALPDGRIFFFPGPDADEMHFWEVDDEDPLYKNLAPGIEAKTKDSVTRLNRQLYLVLRNAKGNYVAMTNNEILSEPLGLDDDAKEYFENELTRLNQPPALEEPNYEWDPKAGENLLAAENATQPLNGQAVQTILDSIEAAEALPQGDASDEEAFADDDEEIAKALEVCRGVNVKPIRKLVRDWEAQLKSDQTPILPANQPGSIKRAD